MHAERERRALKALPALVIVKHISDNYKTLMRSIIEMISIINLRECLKGVKSPPRDAPDLHLRLFSKCISALCEFRAARSLSSNRPVCVNHKNISLLPWIPVWWDMISLGGGCLETLDPGRRKRSGGDVTFLWRVAPPSALRMRGHQTTWNEIFIFSCILCDSIQILHLCVYRLTMYFCSPILISSSYSPFAMHNIFKISSYKT